MIKITSDLAINIINNYDALIDRLIDIKEHMLNAPVQFYKNAIYDEAICDIDIKGKNLILFQEEHTSKIPLSYLDMTNDEIIQDLIDYDTSIKDKEEAAKKAKEDTERDERYRLFRELKKEFMPDQR